MIENGSKFHLSVRIFFVTTGLLLFVLTLLFFIQADWAVQLWPWPAGRLSFIFISSITASSGAAIIYIGLSGEFRTAAAGGATFATIFAGLTAYFYRLSATEPGNNELWTITVVCAIVFLSSVATILLARRQPLHDRRPIPTILRFSFGFFVLALIIAGGQMVSQSNVMPWPVDPRSCVVFGWIFLGAAAGFAYSLFEPYWPMAQEQLFGFLLYDLVLIIPYIQHFPKVRPDDLNSLTVYTCVLIFSGALAIYFLFFNPPAHPNTDDRVSELRAQRLAGGD